MKGQISLRRTFISNKRPQMPQPTSNAFMFWWSKQIGKRYFYYNTKGKAHSINIIVLCVRNTFSFHNSHKVRSVVSKAAANPVTERRIYCPNLSGLFTWCEISIVLCNPLSLEQNVHVYFSLSCN